MSFSFALAVSASDALSAKAATAAFLAVVTVVALSSIEESKPYIRVSDS